MLEIGQEASDFCLPNQDEVEVCLRDLLGSWIVLYFYPKDNTPGCSTEAMDFTALRKEFEALGATVVGISADSPKRHRNFIEKKQLEIMLLSDESHSVLEQYGVWQLKKNYGREYMGIVRTTYLIDPKGVVQALWKRVKVKGHAQEVLERLRQLQQEQ